MNEPHGFAFTLLDEDAASKDLFEDKTHEGVALAISRLIESTDKAVTVGIEGAWGAGKSTVVRFLKRNICDTKGKKTLFFSFDAWAHEGDPLRRVFLENLITHIDPDDQDVKLSKFKGQISRRVKSVTVKSTSAPSKLGLGISLSALLVPIGVAMLSAMQPDKLLSPWNPNADSPDLFFLLGLLMALLPAFVAVWWFLFGDKDDEGKVKWDYFKTGKQESYVQDITEDGERTSVEFESFFDKVLNYCLDGAENKYDRVIIVIDNLDRVDAKQASILWSTLQTFFKHKSHLSEDEPKWRGKVWFLVPHDRESLERVWASSSSNAEGLKSNENGKSFLDKCFQVRFEVPEPVMTSWYSYLSHCVHDGLTGWDQDARDKVILTYQLYYSRISESPTPREIQNFVNQTGVLGLRWGRINSSQSMALYAILRQENTERGVRNILLGGGFPVDLIELGNESEIKMELAGMLFGVAKEKGMQLLLSPLIKETFRVGDGEALHELAETHGEGFWIVWNSEREKLLPGSMHIHEYLVPTTIAVADGLGVYGTRLNKSLTTLFDAWKNSSNDWNLEKNDYAKAFECVVRWYPRVGLNDLLAWVKEVFESKLEHTSESIQGEAVGAGTLGQLCRLSTLLTQNKINLKSREYRCLDHDGWLAWSKKCRSGNFEIPYIAPSDDAIINIYNIMFGVNPDIFPVEPVKALKHALSVNPNSIGWPKVASSLSLWGQRPSRELDNSDTYELMYLLCTSDKGNASDPVLACVRSSGFWSRISSIDPGFFLLVLAGFAFKEELLTTTYVPSAIKDYWRVSNQDKKDFNRIEELLKQGKSIKVLWELAIDKDNYVARYLISRSLNDVNSFISNYPILNFDKYVDSLDFDKRDLAKALVQSSVFKSIFSNLTDNYKKYDVTIYELLEYSGGACLDETNIFLESIDQICWEVAIEENSRLLNCVIYQKVEVNHHYRHALKAQLVKVVSGALQLDEWVWENLDALLDKSLEKELLLREVAEGYFEEQKDYLGEKEFKALIPHLLSSIKELSEESLMDKIDHWLDKDYWSRVQWFVSSNISISVNPLEYLKSRIVELSQALTDKDSKDTLKSLAQKLKILLPFDNSNSDELK